MAEENTALVVKPEAMTAPKGMIGTQELEWYARHFIASGFFPDVRSISAAIVKIQAGKELGFPAFASMQGIVIIKGKASMSGGLLAAKIRREGRYDYVPVKLTQDECVLRFFRATSNGGKEALGDYSFSMADAKNAGLTASDMYRKHPRNMLFNRALANGCRVYCPDVFLGGVTPYLDEELTDTPTKEEETPATETAVAKVRNMLKEAGLDLDWFTETVGEPLESASAEALAKGSGLLAARKMCGERAQKAALANPN